ncbi:MAG: hypothetical protein NT113_19825 [Hyphomicrobiales bacterium]|nr:hypothetical protein [Hyphomicrobiales bacterium]
MTDTHKKARSPGEAIYLEARGARTTSEQLLPLLALLKEDENETGGPLDELKGILHALIEGLRYQNGILERLDAACASASSSPISDVST